MTALAVQYALMRARLQALLEDRERGAFSLEVAIVAAALVAGAIALVAVLGAAMSRHSAGIR